jgi:hypothetical protein
VALLLFLFISDFFNDAVTSSDNVASNDRMISEYELERIWKEAAMTYFKVLSWHLSGGTEENDDKPQSGWPVLGLRFELGTFRILSMSYNRLAATIGLLLK